MGTYKKKPIRIIGHRGRVPNTLYSQENKTEKIAIVFPGSGYTCQMPLLYYTTNLLMESGYDVLQVNYFYKKNFWSLPENKKDEWFYSDIEAVYDALQNKGYKTMALVGKSMGTLALSHLLQHRNIPEGTRLIWLTPILTDSQLLQRFMQGYKGKKSIFITGNADNYFNADVLKNIKEMSNSEIVVIPHADHSLEIGGDCVASLETLKLVLNKIEDFLS